MAALISMSLCAPVAGKARLQAPRRAVVVRATPDAAREKIAPAIKDAEKACADGTSQDCAAAWDTVEELSAAASHAKAAAKADPVSSDPLEQFCAKDPSADECRVYED